MFIDYKHERILSPIGISFDDQNIPMIVLPFMANGSLLNYLKRDVYFFTAKQLLCFALQICEGIIQYVFLKN